MPQSAATSVITIIAIAVVFLFMALKVLAEYERAIIFRLGRVTKAILGGNGPGLILVIPFIDRVVKVDLRTITMDVPTQEIITKDNVPVKVNAVIFLRVVDPNKAIVEVANYINSTSQIAQTTLRSILGQSELDELLSHREKINQELQSIIDEHTDPWGIKVSVVEVKDVEVPQTMQRAMAKQAEAERERRAKVINAEGEFQASQRLSEAAAIIATQPIALQLRFLQTLVEVGSENNSTVIFPVPIDIISHFMTKKKD